MCRQCPLLYAQGGSQIRVVCGTGVDFLRAAEYVYKPYCWVNRLVRYEVVQFNILLSMVKLVTPAKRMSQVSKIHHDCCFFHPVHKHGDLMVLMG